MLFDKKRYLRRHQVSQGPLVKPDWINNQHQQMAPLFSFFILCWEEVLKEVLLILTEQNSYQDKLFEEGFERSAVLKSHLDSMNQKLHLYALQTFELSQWNHFDLENMKFTQHLYFCEGQAAFLHVCLHREYLPIRSMLLRFVLLML